VKLLFGDSNKLIPELINDKCCILIAGPKDMVAIKLCIECLKNPLVKAIFIHNTRFLKKVIFNIDNSIFLKKSLYFFIDLIAPQYLL